MIEEKKRCDIEIEFTDSKRKVYIIITPDEKIWVDLKYLPETISLCVLIDGEDMLCADVGEKGKTKRNFVGIEWLLREVKGELLEALKKRKKKILEDMPRLRKEYWGEE